MKILLAEDDENISVISRMVLEKMGGHEVIWVNNGESALEEALKTPDLDLILLDEMMPKMNGLKVSELYKQKCSQPKPIIFLSAKSQKDEVERFQQEGLGFISKPFDPHQLCKIIEELMSHAKESRP